MLRLPPFRFLPARTLEEATKALANEGEAVRVVAGGTDLWPNLKRRHESADAVIGLRSIAELRGISLDAAEIRVGALTTLTEITKSEVVRGHFPALTRAVASISSPVLRNMGTLGGNLCLDTRCTYYNQNLEWRQSIDYCMKEEGETCWVAPGSPRCWAISASDGAPILCALGARVRLVSAAGERVIPLRELYRDDGIEYLTKRPDEILTEVLVPRTSARASFWKLRRRGSIDFAVLSVGAALTVSDGGIVEEAQVYLGGVNSLPRRCDETCNELEGRQLDASTIVRAAAQARRTARPLDNTDFLARWRGVMVEKYVEGSLREIAGLDAKVVPPP